MDELESSDYATADELMSGDIDGGEEDFVIEGLGRVRLRPLSRAQALAGQRLMQQKGLAAHDAHLIEHGIIRPRLTADQVARLSRRTRAGTLEPVTRKIAQISRMGGEDVERAIADAFRGGSVPGGGLLPSGPDEAVGPGTAPDQQP